MPQNERDQRPSPIDYYQRQRRPGEGAPRFDEDEQSAWGLLTGLGFVCGFVSICPAMIVVGLLHAAIRGPEWFKFITIAMVAVMGCAGLGIWFFRWLPYRKSRPFSVGYSFGFLLILALWLVMAGVAAVVD